MMLKNTLLPIRVFLRFFLIIVGIVSVSGFFMGLRQSTRGEGETSPWLSVQESTQQEKANYPEAPLYKDIPSAEWKANKDWKNELSKLPKEPIDRSPREALDKEALAHILIARINRRAYDGAPPTIPHAINYRDVRSCSVCHSQDSNVLVAGQRAPAMSHPYLANCTQCHAPSEGLAFAVRSGTTGLVVENAFHGTKRSGKRHPGLPRSASHGAASCLDEGKIACHAMDRGCLMPLSHLTRRDRIVCSAMLRIAGMITVRELAHWLRQEESN